MNHNVRTVCKLHVIVHIEEEHFQNKIANKSHVLMLMADEEQCVTTERVNVSQPAHFV